MRRKVRNLVLIGPGVSFLLGYLLLLVPDMISQLVAGVAAVVAYGVIAGAAAMAAPKMRDKKEGLWLALGCAVAGAAIAVLILRLLGQRG